MWALIPDTNTRLLQRHSQAAALCWTNGSFLGNWAWGEARRGSAAAAEKLSVLATAEAHPSLRSEHSKAEHPAFLYPVVKGGFRKGSLHNCVHLTNMYPFLVYGSALHFLYPELHYLITNQKHIGPKQRLLYSQAEIAMKYPVFTIVRQTCYS